MSYNLTFAETANTYYDLTKGVNDLTAGLPMVFILLALFIIIYATFKNYDSSAALLISGFGTSLIAILMWGGQLIGYNVLVVVLMIFFASIINKIMRG